MRNIAFSILLIFTIVMASCNGKKDNNGNQNTNDNQAQVSGPSYLKLITIKPGNDIRIDNPRAFIEIGILFNHEQQTWVKELRSDTNINGEEFLNKKRNEFYASYGIKETDIAIYNQNHYQDIETFLNENPEFRQAYQDSAGDDYDVNY